VLLNEKDEPRFAKFRMDVPKMLKSPPTKDTDDPIRANFLKLNELPMAMASITLKAEPNLEEDLSENAEPIVKKSTADIDFETLDIDLSDIFDPKLQKLITETISRSTPKTLAVPKILAVDPTLITCLKLNELAKEAYDNTERLDPNLLYVLTESDEDNMKESKTETLEAIST
jgi:hypothetical protein